MSRVRGRVACSKYGVVCESEDILRYAAVADPQITHVYISIFPCPATMRAVRACSVGWHPSSSSVMASLDDDAVTMWDVATSSAKSTGSAKPPEGESFSSLRWNPHHGAAFVATASGPHVRCWDTRSMEMTSTIKGAHGGSAVRCLDFNPNKQVGQGTHTHT